MKSPIALLNGLCLDLQRLNPGVKGLNRDIITIEKRFENEGYGFLTIALPALGAALVIGLSTGKFTCPIGFKKVKGGTIPLLFSGMFCKVFDPLTGLLVENPDMGCIKGLRNLCMLYKKTQLSPEDEDILHKKAVSEFYQCDDTASRVLIPDRHDHLIGRVCKLILNNLNSKDVSDAKYKHGPGAVREGYKSNEKYKALFELIRVDDPQLWPFLPVGVGAWEHLDRLGRGSGVLTDVLARNCEAPEDLSNALSAIDKSTSAAGIESLSNRASRSIARLISVPKNSTSRRTITVEPMAGQFIQQGLNSILRDCINECGVLSKSIALTNQSLNQKLALEGSRYDNWATIDLKSASDLLSVTLVKSVFRHNAQFLEHMMDCRSPYVECKDRTLLHLGKFAGMGNALTFPVQSVCFAVVCIAAILDSQGLTPNFWNVRRASRCIRVYGDDIIIKREYAHQCVNWLTDVGLKVNISKSFLTGNFKESCGVEAYRGVDITPLYIKHRPDQTKAEPSAIAGFVALSNSMWMEGLYEASAWLKNEVERLLGRALPLVSRDSGALGWHSRLDAMTPHKWCQRTHRFMTRTLALASMKRSDKLDGYAALYKCLSSARYDDLRDEFGEQQDRSKVQKNLFPEPMALDKDHLSRSSIRYKTRILPRWVPTLVRDGLNPVV
jgi:hypothetical protein